ncbi:MAG: glutamine-synthetase adenylyltransferase, partial [Alphaproteobacteria bacterium]|nr:glutamine-synthetase adenylyltransferase [Alphaproteobacteria bacterium]
MSQSLSSLSDRIPVATLPAPADGAQAQRGIERWLESDHSPELAEFARKLAGSDAGRRLLEALFGNAPFLTQCCLHEPRFLRQILRHGPDAAFARLIRGLDHRSIAAKAGRAGDRAALMRALRVARRRAALLIAIADITSLWPLERITGALSAFAEAVLGRAVRHLLGAAVTAGEIAPRQGEDATEGSGLIILGMGKLGGREINYSSDIDLIVLFDGERVNYTGRSSVQQCFARLARELVRILDERTVDGYVFRTDLRLRPDPASTPPALSVQAALTYYESTGQNWERAALIKARPVAGDRAAGEAFLRELRPFLWRKHLDFAAIQDIH